MRYQTNSTTSLITKIDKIMKNIDVVSLNPKKSVKMPAMNGPVPCHHIDTLSPTACKKNLNRLKGSTLKLYHDLARFHVDKTPTT